MKRLVTVLLISALLLSVTSCGYISDKLNKFYTFAENTEITFYTEQEENSQNTDVYEKEKKQREEKIELIKSLQISVIECFSQYLDKEELTERMDTVYCRIDALCTDILCDKI